MVGRRHCFVAGRFMSTGRWIAWDRLIYLRTQGRSTDRAAMSILSRRHAKLAFKDSAKRWLWLISDQFGDAWERESFILKKYRRKLQPPMFEIGHRNLSDERGKTRSERQPRNADLRV
jgi:hypothetical protein